MSAANGYQLQQVWVALLLFAHKRGVQCHLIGGPVGDQYPAIPIQELSSGGLYRLFIGYLSVRLLQVVGPVDLLQIIQHPKKDQQQGTHHRYNHMNTGMKLLSFHRGLLRIPSAWAHG